MKAIVYERYGPPEVLQIKEVPKPLPKDNEVLISIHAALVSTGDCELRVLKMPNLIWVILRLFVGVFRPRKNILGAYLSGVVEEVGKDVTKYKAGDQVYACSGAKFSAYAEYITLREDKGLAAKPENISHQEACAVPMGIDAVHFLKKAHVQNGEKVLVNGAGGSIGTVAVQLAKYYGAHVTAVDSPDKLDMLSSIGADHVIDYTKKDFTKDGAKYDVIFDLVMDSSYSGCLNALSPNGRYLLVNPGGISEMLRGYFTSRTGTKKVISVFADANHEDLVFLKDLIESGKLKSVIDSSYRFEEIVDAHRYVESGQKKGSVVLTVI